MVHKHLSQALLATLLCVSAEAPVSEEVENPLEQLVGSTWKVEGPNEQFGTAFLVDSRGYFVTAAHVVAKAQGNEGIEYHHGLELVQPDGTRSQATVVQSWCEKLDTVLNTCRKGRDVVLLKTSAVPEAIRPYDLGFAAYTPNIFAAHYTGYSSRVVGPAPSASHLFTTVNVASHDEYRNYFEPDSATFYQTSGESFPGNSGGPITVVENGRHNVVGVMNWRKPGHNRDDKAGPSFACTIPVLREIWGAVPPRAGAQEIADRAGSVSSDIWKAGLHKEPNTTIVDVVDELAKRHRESQVGPAYWYALYDVAVMRRLDFEKVLMEEYVDIRTNYGWVREAAKTHRRIGRFHLAAGEAAVAGSHFRQAITLNEAFLAYAQAQGDDWYGNEVFADAASEMVELHEGVGAEREAFSWGYAGSSNGDSRSSVELARRELEHGEHMRAAELYGLAHVQLRDKGKDTPTYIVESYAFARSLSTSESGVETLPNTIFEYRAGQAKLVPEDLERGHTNRWTAGLI